MNIVETLQVKPVFVALSYKIIKRNSVNFCIFRTNIFLQQFRIFCIDRLYDEFVSTENNTKAVVQPVCSFDLGLVINEDKAFASKCEFCGTSAITL